MNLLIVDDHRMLLDGMRAVLNYEYNGDIKITTAYDGREAVEYCKQQAFDVIILDINMPIMDGLEATKEIKNMSATAIIIIVSMQSLYTVVAQALKAGANAFVVKSEGIEEIVAAITHVMQGKVYISKLLQEQLSLDESNLLQLKDNSIQFAESLISPRELEILKYISKGFTNEEIASTLFLSSKTVDTHRKNMLRKLKLPNTAALVRYAFEHKFLS